MASVSEIELCTHTAFVATVQRVPEFTTNFRRVRPVRSCSSKAWHGWSNADRAREMHHTGQTAAAVVARCSWSPTHFHETESGARLCDHSSAIQGSLAGTGREAAFPCRATNFRGGVVCRASVGEVSQSQPEEFRIKFLRDVLVKGCLRKVAMNQTDGRCHHPSSHTSLSSGSSSGGSYLKKASLLAETLILRPTVVFTCGNRACGCLSSLF